MRVHKALPWLSLLNFDFYLAKNSETPKDACYLYQSVDEIYYQSMINPGINPNNVDQCSSLKDEAGQGQVAKMFAVTSLFNTVSVVETGTPTGPSQPKNLIPGKERVPLR